jgi:hypothetical protein
VLQENAMNRFGIYKLPGMHDVTADEAPRRLPRAAQHIDRLHPGRCNPHFEAVGSKIIVTAEGDTISPKSDSTQFVTLLYDTRTGTLDCGGALPDPDESWIKDGYHAAATVGDKQLWVLEADENTPFYLYECRRPHATLLVHLALTGKQATGILASHCLTQPSFLLSVFLLSEVNMLTTV